MPLDVAAAAHIVALIVLAASGVWKLTRVENALSEKITRSRDEIEARQDTATREVGETIAALRQKVAEVELYAANNYVRRDGFYKVRDQMTSDIKELRRELVERLDRMEVKIDSKT